MKNIITMPDPEKIIENIDLLIKLYYKKVYKISPWQEKRGCYFCQQPFSITGQDRIIMINFLKKPKIDIQTRTSLHKSCIRYYVKNKEYLDELIREERYEEFIKKFKNFQHKKYLNSLQEKTK